MEALELKVPPVVSFLACAVCMWATRSVVPVADFRMPCALYVVATLFLTGLAVGVSGVRRFRKNSTTVHPCKPEDATTLVQGGVYRHTRNPMYLGLVFCLCAWGVYLGNAAILLWVIGFVFYMTRFQIRPEEQVLLAKFGAEYANYTSKTRRWL